MSVKTCCAVLVLAGAVAFVLAPARAAAQMAEAKKEALKKPVTVTSDRMEARKNEGTVLFTGDVVAVEDFTLCADSLAIAFGKDTEVNEMTASGNVRIFQNDKTASADRAVYNRKDRTLLLSGRSQVKRCSDVVKGDRIKVHMDDDRAVVESDGGRRVKAVIMPVKNCSADAAHEKGISEEARCKRSR